MGEPCTCGRRMSELGPWDQAENLDHWREGQWGQRESDTWKWPWQPRTCSFCGSAHPQDILKLIDEGWEIEPSDKGYKLYLNPPGWLVWRRERQAEYEAICQSGDTAEKVAERHRAHMEKPLPEHLWSPGPPVKGYTQHFTKAEVQQLNECLAAQRRR